MSENNPAHQPPQYQGSNAPEQSAPTTPAPASVSKGVKLMPSTKLIEVTKKGAKVQNIETGEEQLLECDTVLLSLGVKANTELYDEIAKAFPNAKLIGDATTPDGKVYRTLEAVNAGYKEAMAF